MKSDIQEYIELNSTQLKNLRNELLKHQNYKCAICGKYIDKNTKAALDHQHKINKMQSIGEDGAGLVRGVLCQECNILEGKIWNNCYRYKHFKSVKERIEWLNNLIKYYKNNKTNYIHPSEKQYIIVSKRQFNKLSKLYSEKYPNRIPLEYPKSKKLTKKLKIIFDYFNISPY